MIVGTQYLAMHGMSTVYADMDFETYSECDFEFNATLNKWESISGAQQPGLPAVGAAVYSEHPSTEVLVMQYDLKDGKGPRIWVPEMNNPEDLFNHMSQGGLIEAHNSMFEYLIWLNTCCKRYGWPTPQLDQFRCSMAKCRAVSLPASLDNAGEALNTKHKKMVDGKSLIRFFSVPRNPTKNNPAKRNILWDNLEKADKLFEYCLYDIKTEADISSRVPDLQPQELEMWLTDQRINARGVSIDAESVHSCIRLMEAAFAKYTEELISLTNGLVDSPNKFKQLKEWINSHGVGVESVDKSAVASMLKRKDLPDVVRRVLNIRSILGAQSVKKLYALKRRLCRDNRVRDVLVYCGADRTGRFAGRGPQPQNIPNSGPDVMYCKKCRTVRKVTEQDQQIEEYPCQCGGTLKLSGWSAECAESVLYGINSGISLEQFEAVMGEDTIGAISGCLRGMFCAAPGKDLICADYSAIEAVGLACLAGEEWRIEVFRTHGMIYEMSAAKISGIPFEDFLRHKKETGDHHPLRKKIGKIAELASGYGGGLGAWKAFGADKHLSDDDIKENVKKWRAESPKIKGFWYALENAAKWAIHNPGKWTSTHKLHFAVFEGTLYIRLLSGRYLCYHQVSLQEYTNDWGKRDTRIQYYGWNSDRAKGAVGWVQLDTWGGKLAENVTQAVCRDIMAYALVNLEKAGYPIVLHVHDEAVAEVPEGEGSTEEFKKIMATLPDWCSDWPVRASGEWRGKRYRKD